MLAHRLRRQNNIGLMYRVSWILIIPSSSDTNAKTVAVHFKSKPVLLYIFAQQYTYLILHSDVIDSQLAYTEQLFRNQSPQPAAQK